MSSITSAKGSIRSDHYDPSTASTIQSGRNWKAVILIPHQIWWKILIVITVLMNITIALYCLVFTNTHSTLSFTLVYYACEITYFSDVVLAVIYRCKLMHNSGKLHFPRHALLLTIDIISLLPIHELYYIMEHCSSGDEDNTSRDHTRLKVILRLQYVISFSRDIKNYPGINQILVVIFKQFYILALYVVFAASLWFLLRNDSQSTWINHLEHMEIDRNSSFDWFVICVSVIANGYMHSSAGVISISSVPEYYIFSITMLVGCLMHVMIFFGELTSQHIQKFRHQLDFSKRLTIIIKMMRDWHTDEDSQKKTVEHYNKYWEMRQGMKNPPSIYKTLPLAMQKEVALDLFWDCLMHSQLFNECEINFKRSLSLRMNTEFYLPGDYLFSPNQQKHKMTYLASGIVQILSQEDQESPVMSFSSGTLFGETAAMIMIPSLINLRCATYCEIHTLDLRSLCSVMSQYKQAAKMLHGKLAQRIADAKMMQNPVLLKMKDKQQKRTSIRWLKTQWRSIYRQSKKRNVDAREISTTPCHMSNYLNMYALSGDVELKERVICLKSTCPYVLEPTSSFSKFVEYVIVLVVVKQVMMLPYDIFFNANMSNKNAGLFYMLDLIYVFGLYFQMSTAVKTKELLLTEPKDIIMFKSKQLSVILDVIAVFPFEFVGYAVGSSDYTCMLMHLNRTLKLHKVYTFERAAEKSLLSKVVRLRFFKFTLIFAYLVYFFGCMLYGVACPNKKCFKYSWFAYHQNVTEQLFNNTDRSERGTDFMTSIDYAISLMLGLTDSAIYSYTTTDIILGMFTTFIGYYIFSFCFSELAACTVIYLQENNDFQEFLKTLKVFSSNPNLPLSLKRNMYEMTICEWYYSERHAITGETGILNDAPDNLKKSILYQRIVDCLLTVPVFQECERSILWKLAPLALLNVVPPGTLISREGTFQKYVKVILRGYCRVESSIPTDSYRGNYGIYSTGKVFPLIESFLDINSFIKVVSITFAEIACIPFQSVVCQFKNNDPDFYTDLKISLEQFLQQYDTILMRRKGRLPEMVSSKKSRGKGDFFTYDTNEKFDDEKCRTVVEIGKWTFVQRFFLKSTLSPKKFVYVVWECFRCSVSFVNIVYTMTILKYAMAIHVDTYIQIFFVLITCIDFYIRLHCQYYNRNGIIVTHPWYTAKNYISGAFLMDLFANAPITFLGIESMLHGRLKDTITVALLILTRPFQIYRVYCGIEYARSLNKEEKGILLGRIKYLVMVCVIFLTMAAMLEHYTCGYERGTSVVYSCTSNSWIKQSMFGRNVSHFDMVVITNYRVLSLFTTCGLGIFPMKRYYEVIIYLVYIFVLFTLKWVLLAKIISAAIKGNTKLTQYQHDVNVMVKYLQKYLVSKTLTKEAVEHYENLFNRSHGYNVNDFVASFFYVLYTDFAYFMYWPTLKTAELFSGCKSADIRYLCTHFKQCSYKRDARIIRCNDVQELCYIVYKGKVKISIAGTKLKILSPGGSFGCFHVGKTRQTISAIAMVHVELLCVESRLLYIISQKFPQLREKLKKAQYLNTEYMASTHMGRSVASVLVHSESVYMKRWQRFLINPGARWFLAYNYILSVHISTITSMLVIAVVARMDIEKSYYLYIVDVVFLTRLLIGFHLSYVDHETGILVRDFKSIAKKYLTEWTGFCFDLFTSFPLELIATTITNNKIVYFCCWCNRSVRFLHLIFYYNHCKNKLTASKTLKWTFFMYLIAIVIHFMATIWWLGACPNDVCYYVDEVRRDSSVPTASKQFFLNFRISYLYVISIFSSTGVAHQIPRTILELAISIAIIIVSQIMIYTLTSGFANILRLGKYVLNNYEHEMKHLDVFITNANVSIPLINKVREYFVILWLHYSGVSMPSLIAQAPGYLKQDIMYALYGYHITNHVLFSKTHIDFIRQLLVHMDPQVYLPGQYVIEKGDIDGRMYFLHDGEVKVFDKQGNNEIEQCVLSKGASFGEYQAMKHIEHACSVKTTVICVVITLRTLDWNYLLDWFPASREILESRLSTMSPTHIVTKN